MTTSLLGLVKIELVRVLQDADLGSVTRSYGYEGDTTGAEHVYLGRARATHKYANARAGRKHRDETGTLELIVQVRKDGGTQQEADERFLEITAAVENAIADSPVLSEDLAAAGLTWGAVESIDLIPAITATGPGCVGGLTVTYTARLT